MAPTFNRLEVEIGPVPLLRRSWSALAHDARVAATTVDLVQEPAVPPGVVVDERAIVSRPACPTE